MKAKLPPCTLLAADLLAVGALALSKQYQASAVFFALAYLCLLPDVRHHFSGLQFAVAFASALLLGVALDVAAGAFPLHAIMLLLLLATLWLRRLAQRFFRRTRCLWMETALVLGATALLLTSLLLDRLALWKLAILAPMFGVATYATAVRLRRAWRQWTAGRASPVHLAAGDASRLPDGAA